MIAESLKSQINSLTPSERQELAAYLAKLELENDEDYWGRIRRRLADDSAEKWVSAHDL